MKRWILIVPLLLLVFSCSKKQPLPTVNEPSELFISWESDTGLVEYYVTENNVKGVSRTLTLGFNTRYFVFAYEIGDGNLIQLTLNNHGSSATSQDTIADLKATIIEGTKAYSTSNWPYPNEVSFYFLDTYILENNFSSIDPVNENSYFEITKVEEVNRGGKKYLKFEFEFDFEGVNSYREGLEFSNGKGAAAFPLEQI